ncbi:hypothetical protein OSTOST_24165, partial [Ostertagia ostertagi]
MNVMSSETYELLPCSRYSTLTKAERVMAWTLKFLRRLAQGLPKARMEDIIRVFPELDHTDGLGDNILSGVDIKQARKALVRLHQRSFSPSYLKTMDNTLKLFRDSDCIWRARGRLGHSDLNEESRFPILIAPKSELSRLIIQNGHATERIWKAWHTQYLLSLREQHRKWVNSGRNSKSAPHVGAIVLLVDPVLSRNEWRLARVTAVHKGEDDAIREVCLLTATGRTIKRPVNLLVPLELDCDLTDQQSGNSTRPRYQVLPRDHVQTRYNLRSRL